MGVAAVVIGFKVESIYNDGNSIDFQTLTVRLSITFVITALLTLFLSYLVIHAWRYRPSRLYVCFWLGVISVTLGMLLGSCQYFDDLRQGQGYTIPQTLILILIWSVALLVLLLILYSFREFFRWLFSWRIVKRGLLVVTGFTLLVLAFYAEENWRGNRAWEKCKHEMEANGEKFDLIAFAPSPVPDEQNFAMAPIVVSSYAGRLHSDANQARKYGLGEFVPDSTNVDRMALELQRTKYNFPTNVTIGHWQEAKLTDLKSWQDYYRASFVTNMLWSHPPGVPGMVRPGIAEPNNLEDSVVSLETNEFPTPPQPQSPAADVLLALSRFDPAIAELRQAGERPFSRFPLEYQSDNTPGILFPHLASLKSCVLVLQLRSIAELQGGQTAAALADVMLMLRLAESIHHEPALISHLVRLALVNLALQPVWEGMAERRWSDAELKELGGRLEKLDLSSDLLFTLHAERVTFLEYIGYMKKHRDYSSRVLIYAVCPRVFDGLEQGWDYLPDMPDIFNAFTVRLERFLPEDFSSHILEQLAPAGWYDWNKVAAAKTYQERVFQIARPEKHLISRQAVVDINMFCIQAWQPNHINHHNVLALMELPAVSTGAHKSAFTQNAVDMAIVACALERYRLAKGEYPERLAVLAPEYLKTIPPDVVDGLPLHYRRTQDGSFALYSVGWNGQDDGGVIGRDNSGRLKPELGDWVWQYPAK